MSVTCPVDKKDDAIQSLPALVSGGRSSGSFSGPSGGVTYTDGKYGYTSGSTHLYGSLTSDTAQALAAPLPPKKMGFWSFVGWSWIFLLSACTIIGVFIVWPRFKEAIVKNPEEQEKVFTPGVTIASVILLLFSVDPICWLFIPSLLNTIYTRTDFPRRYKLWQEAYTKWKKLYYCHRCGIFFNPDTNEHYPLNQLNDYLCIHDFE